MTAANPSVRVVKSRGFLWVNLLVGFAWIVGSLFCFAAVSPAGVKTERIDSPDLLGKNAYIKEGDNFNFLGPGQAQVGKEILIFETDDRSQKVWAWQVSDQTGISGQKLERQTIYSVNWKPCRLISQISYSPEQGVLIKTDRDYLWNILLPGIWAFITGGLVLTLWISYQNRKKSEQR